MTWPRRKDRSVPRNLAGPGKMTWVTASCSEAVETGGGTTSRYYPGQNPKNPILSLLCPGSQSLGVKLKSPVLKTKTQVWTYSSVGKLLA